ncbi:MAG TPA: carboxypeptidase-like regulatory domain-containing protein [Planctomycetota bacterium]|nr:carboxypeptidase-like regulatory domain-containing protein [Planctomycetota bacterium]
MSRRSLAPLLALLALLAASAFWLVRTVGRDAATSAEQTTPVAATPASETHEPPALTTALPDAQVETATATPARELASGSEALGPDDLLWFEGRVRLPDGTPVDEHVEVMALADTEARRFAQTKLGQVQEGNGTTLADDDEWAHAARALVAPDGSFRVSVPKSAALVSIDLAARYLYLPERLQIDTKGAAGASPIALSPRLGGCIHGRLILPPNALDRRASLVGTGVQLEAMAEGRSAEFVQRTAKADGALEFELGGIPEKRHTWITADVKDMVHAVLDDVNIEAGRVAAVDIELVVGVHVSGRVVDEHGDPVGGVQLLTLVELGRFTSSGETGKLTDAMGKFDFPGIPPGTITLEASKEGWSDSSLAVGELEDGTVKEGLSLVLRRGLSISGRVQSSDGRPANRCRIDVFQHGEQSRQMRDEQRVFSTKADGTFEISGLGSEPLSLTATVGGLEQDAFEADADAATDAGAKIVPSKTPALRLMAHIEGVKPGSSGLVLTLDAGKSVRGRAVDDMGHPVAHFQIFASPVDGSQPWERAQRAVRGSGNAADGNFELAGLHDGAWDLRAEAKGHAASAPHRIVIPRDTESFDLVLARAASIAGTVRDADGTPIEHAIVRVAPADTWRALLYQSSDDEGASTDASGNFLLEGVSPGPQRISASSLGCADSEHVAIDLAPGESMTGVALALRRGGRVVGDVLDDQGHARPGAGVSLNGLTIHTFHSSTADAAGHFDVGGLTPGKYWISTQLSQNELAVVTRQGNGGIDTAWARNQNTTTIDVLEGETTRVVLGGAMRDGIRIHGAITCAGRPAANWLLWITRAEGGGAAQLSAASDARGQYEVSVEGAGTYSFSLNQPDGGISFSDRLDVPVGASFEHDVVIPSGRIAGRVVGADGAPVPEIEVLVQPDERTVHLSNSATYGQIESDGNGAFVFEGLKAGTYCLRVNEEWFDETPKWGACTRAGIVLAEGAHVDGIEIRLSVAARIEGKVVGPDGQVVAGATVMGRDEQGTPLQHGPPTITDGSGSFSIDGLAAGKVTIMAWTKSLVTAGSLTVVVHAGETTRVALSLVQGTVLRVFVRGADGKAVGASVRVEDEHGKAVGEQYAFDEQSWLGEDSPEAGQTIGPLPPGRYKVTATNHDKQSVSQDVSVSGAEQTVTLKYGG